MRVILEILTGSSAGKKLVIQAGQTVKVGRFDRADVILRDDVLLSSCHFALEHDAQGCRVRDLNSRFDTLVNDQRVTDARLRDGDKILAGQTIFRVRLEEDQAAPAAPRVPPAGDVKPALLRTAREKTSYRRSSGTLA
jgi:pSer/pThr/pTyr-binding forkhead associated (FHA) protein